VKSESESDRSFIEYKSIGKWRKGKMRNILTIEANMNRRIFIPIIESCILAIIHDDKKNSVFVE